MKSNTLLADLTVQEEEAVNGGWKEVNDGVYATEWADFGMGRWKRVVRTGDDPDHRTPDDTVFLQTRQSFGWGAPPDDYNTRGETLGKVIQLGS